MRLYLESLESSSDLRIFHSKPTFNGFHASPMDPRSRGAQAPTGAGALPTCSPSAAPLAGAASSHVARGSPRTPGRTASTGRTSPGDGRTRGRGILWGRIACFFLGKLEDVLKFWDLAFFKSLCCIEHLRVSKRVQIITLSFKSNHLSHSSSWMTTSDKRLGAANQCR